MDYDAIIADEDDAYIYDQRDGYSVALNGRHIGTYHRRRRAEAALYCAMQRAGYYPNVWHVNDHGNTELYYFDSHVLTSLGVGYV